MPRTRLFISHSSPEAPSHRRLDDICSKLTAAGFDILVDRTQIQSGDEWRNRIHVMLAECQAALILLDPVALASAWVLKEATILAWRKDLEKALHLVLVRFRGVSVDDLETRRYAPLLLTELQHVVAGDDADVIVDAVRQKIPATVAAPSLFDLIVADMAALIEGLSVSDVTLEDICRRQDPSILFTAGESRKRRFAAVLAKRLLVTGPDCLDTAVELLDEFGTAAQKDVVTRLARLIEPLWVDSEAAALMQIAAGRKGEVRDVALFCSRPGNFSTFVARDYVRRAFLRSSTHRLAYVENAHAGDVAAHVAGRLRDGVRRLPRYVGFSDEEVDRLLADPLAKDPTFAVLPSVVDDEALAVLRQTFPRVTFLMRTDAAGATRPGLPAGVRYVEPELSLKEEDRVFFGLDRLSNLLGNLV